MAPARVLGGTGEQRRNPRLCYRFIIFPQSLLIFASSSSEFRKIVEKQYPELTQKNIGLQRLYKEEEPKVDETQKKGLT